VGIGAGAAGRHAILFDSPVKKVAAGLALGLAGSVIVLMLDLLFAALAGGTGRHALRTVELKTYDWRLEHTARPETARTDIALVEIDESTLRNLQPNVGRWPWPRVVHASIFDYLSRGKPRVIAYDVNFADPDLTVGFQYGDDVWSGRESDAALIEAVRSAGNVIMLADATFEGRPGDAPPPADPGYRLGPGILDRPVIFAPFGGLASASAALGHNFFVLDPDGPIRHTVPFVGSEGRYLPSLGVAAALHAWGLPPSEVSLDGGHLRFAERAMPLSRRRVGTAGGTQEYLWALINFRGPALLADLKSRPYPRYSFFDLLYSEEQILAGVAPDVDPAVFRDKIVFVGVTAAGLHDVFETPFARGKMPGIQIHAAVADDILSNRFIRPAGVGSQLALILVAGLLIGTIATLLPAWYATAATLAVGAAFGWATVLLFARGLWIPLSEPTLAMALALFGGVGYQYFVEGREKRQVKRLFGRYVSKDVYDQLLADPARARLGGQRREMTVLFSDIRGFTTFSEAGQPEEIVAVLNVYFTHMVDIVFRHKGTLDKFVGDMVMALFGAPLDDADHADHAVEAALEMIDELQRLNKGWQAEGRTELDIGIGINTGSMIAGNIGSEAIMSYTVIGDAVNLGARLESLNKNYGTRIIISDATRSRLKGRYAFRALGEVVVKGKSYAVPIFEVVGRADQVSDVPTADTVEPAATTGGSGARV
jgi:adenylate cyclase